MVFEKLQKILAAQFDIDPETVTPETDIQEDLNADSLDVVDLIMSVEDEFEVEVPDTAVDEVKTVGDLVRFIESQR